MCKGVVLFQRCPKCQFEQPADDFCAKCGVHIPSYQSPTPSLRERTFKSSAFYLFLIVCLSLGSFYYFSSKFHGFEQKIEKYNLEQLGDSLAADTETATPSKGLVKPLLEPIQKSLEEVEKQNAGPKALAKESEEKIAWQDYEWEILFLEGPAAPSLDFSEESSRQRGDNYEIYKLDSESLRLESFDVLELVRSPVVPNDDNNSLAFEQLSLGAAFNSQWRWSRENLRIKIEWLSSIRIETESPFSSAFTFSDYLKPSQKLLLRGFIPNLDWLPPSELRVGPLAIFASDFFQNSESQFYVLVQLKAKKAGSPAR